MVCFALFGECLKCIQYIFRVSGFINNLSSVRFSYEKFQYWKIRIYCRFWEIHLASLWSILYSLGRQFVLFDLILFSLLKRRNINKEHFASVVVCLIQIVCVHTRALEPKKKKNNNDNKSNPTYSYSAIRHTAHTSKCKCKTHSIGFSPFGSLTKFIASIRLSILWRGQTR